jgi:maltooligosyltrehalose trehalohydrolase
MNERRYSAGAEIVADVGTHFRVFAPKRSRVEVVIEGAGERERERSIALRREADGYHSGLGDGVPAGARYRLRFDGGDRLFPDPASRFQPEGPHGPSEVVDPSTFRWTDQAWRGPTLRGQVVYEMHVGTFTREGTYAAAARELAELRDLGITLIELMPVAEFPGDFGWGYDGVDLYAPTRLYGRPDDLRAFVDRAHALGLGVILDVVYNHLGPSGNYLRETSDHYFTDRYDNEWGDAIDFETERGARAYFLENVGYWIDEFHFDGLRFDATQSIHDQSEVHVLTEMSRLARKAAGSRSVLLFAENEPQDANIVRPIADGGHGFDGVWNDDFHHSAHVAATGRAEAYYAPTRGTAQELISAVRWGYLFQGQHYTWQKKRRGCPSLDLAPPAFTVFLENHDQVANSMAGDRLHRLTSPGVHRALTALLLLAPGTPLLFQGQEFASSAPFTFFADHEPELARLVANGRREFLAQFPSIAPEAVQRALPEPHDRATFERCKLDFSERVKNRATYELFRDLLRLRREDATFAAQDGSRLHGAVLAPRTLALRFGTGTGADRLLIVNLGDDVDAGIAAEPLIAPPRAGWRILFSTEDARYGGAGTPALGDDGRILVLGSSAIVLAPAQTEKPGGAP